MSELVEVAQLEPQGAARPGVGAVAQARGPLLRPGGHQVDVDRDLDSRRLVAARHHLDALEVGAVGERLLQQQQPVGRERVALLEADVTLQQRRPQEVLVEAHRPEAVERPGLVVQDDARGVGGQVDLDLADQELAVEVAVRRGVVVECLLAHLVGDLHQRLAFVQREGVHQLLETVVARPVAEQLEVAGGHLELRPLVDLVMGHPGGAVVAERGVHHHPVVAEGLQRLLDLVGRLAVQAADARLVEVLVLARLLDLQVGEGVLAQLAAQPVNLDPQRLGGARRPRLRGRHAGAAGAAGDALRARPAEAAEPGPDQACLRRAGVRSAAAGAAAPGLGGAALTSGLVVSTGFAPGSGAGRSPTKSCE